MTVQKIEHPELGIFRRREGSASNDWRADLAIPAFAIFRYRRNGSFRGTSKVPIDILSHDEAFEPKRTHFLLAQRIVKNQDVLAARIKKAFYDDLLAIGPDSGMYWRNDEDALADCANVLRKRLKRDTLEAPDDLELLIGSPSITIWDSGEPKLTATIDFDAAFEDEHDAGILTDGTRVLGLGYDREARPYVKDRT